MEQSVASASAAPASLPFAPTPTRTQLHTADNNSNNMSSNGDSKSISNHAPLPPKPKPKEKRRIQPIPVLEPIVEKKDGGSGVGASSSILPPGSAGFATRQQQQQHRPPHAANHSSAISLSPSPPVPTSRTIIDLSHSPAMLLSPGIIDLTHSPVISSGSRSSNGPIKQHDAAASSTVNTNGHSMRRSNFGSNSVSKHESRDVNGRVESDGVAVEPARKRHKQNDGKALAAATGAASATIRLTPYAFSLIKGDKMLEMDESKEAPSDARLKHEESLLSTRGREEDEEEERKSDDSDVEVEGEVSSDEEDDEEQDGSSNMNDDETEQAVNGSDSVSMNSYPSESAQSASILAMEQRLQRFLEGAELIGPTTEQQRRKMSKDRLLQRNIEIQARQFAYDREYDRVLSEKPSGWEQVVNELDAANDVLAEESDEVETILFEKYRVVGGGRSLLGDEVLMAAEVGASMADSHRSSGMPVPTLTPARSVDKDGKASRNDAAAAAAAVPSNAVDIAATSSVPATPFSATRADGPAAAPSLDAASLAARAATSAAVAASFPQTAHSQAAILARLEAEDDARAVRRAERVKKMDEKSLLGKYFQFFDKYVVVERVKQPATAVRKTRALQPPPSYHLYLGTMMMPLYRDGIYANEDEKENARALDDDAMGTVNGEDSSSPSAHAVAPPSHTRKRRRTTAAPAPDEEHGKLEDGIVPARASTDAAESSEQDEDEKAKPPRAQDVWLDFAYDPRYIDGCLVQQVQPRPTAEHPNATDTITIGLLPLAGLHPPVPDEPTLEFDEAGEPLPMRKVARPMPNPDHPLAALLILHEAGVIRLESVMLPADKRTHAHDDDDDTSHQLDRVEVTILVDSRIYDKHLLRSTAQKEALLTFFRLFSPSAHDQDDFFSSRPPPPTHYLYPNAEGRLVEYTQLTDAERRHYAMHEHDDAETRDVQQSSESSNPSLMNVSEPAYDGVVDMELDDDGPSMSVKVEVPLTTAPPARQPSGPFLNGESVGALDREVGGEDEMEAEEKSDDDEADDSADEYDSDTASSDDGEDEDEDEDDELMETMTDQHRVVYVDLQLPSSSEEEDEVGQSEESIVEVHDDEEHKETDPAPSDHGQSQVASNQANRERAVRLAPPTKVKREEGVTDDLPDSSADDAMNGGNITNGMAAKEAALLAKVAREDARLNAADAAAGGGGTSKTVPLSEEEQQLDREARAEWRPDSLHRLFESIRPTPRWTRLAAQPAELISTLRPFQQRALAWMMARETEQYKDMLSHPLWDRVQLNGRVAWYNPFAGVLQRQEPPMVQDVRGGILSDEMGLGKTVCMIALILSLRWDPSQRPAPYPRLLTFTAAGCPQSSFPFLSPARLPPLGATLIVTPMSILHQWHKEIQLHAPSLRITIYEGPKSAHASAEVAHIHYLEVMNRFQHSDVILTTYAVLGAEVNYSRKCKYNLRGVKQYAVPKSPLLDNHFHRVVLDESQLVHNSFSVCFRMAARLSSTSRWCVSGTPIGPQGLHDLYGLVSFLGVAPFALSKSGNDKSDASASTWRHAMRAHTDAGLRRLQTLLRRIMWRHSKVHVLSEVCIPPLHVRRTYLSFSKVEAEYYRRLETDCQSKVYFEGSKGRLEDRSALKKLESLRQACAHPQAAAGTFLGTRVLTLPEIGQRLVKRVENEGGTYERDLCKAYNKLALELIRQGREEEAEEVLIKSWTIEDRGVVAELKQEQDDGNDGSGNGTQQAGTAASRAAAVFESKVNIVEPNTQVNQWRRVELVTCYHLAQIYARRLRSQFGVEVEPLNIGQEKSEETFKSIMAKAEAHVQALREKVKGKGVGMSEVDVAAAAVAIHQAETDAINAQPPQLRASSSSQAAADLASGQADTQDSLLAKYHRQREQYDYCLHDLFDLVERDLSDLAISIALHHEADLLPKWLESSCDEVKQLCELRLKVGVDTFNSWNGPYMEQVTTLLTKLKNEQNQWDSILTLYDVSHSRLLVERQMAQLGLVDSSDNSGVMAVCKEWNLDPAKQRQLHERHLQCMYELPRHPLFKQKYRHQYHRIHSMAKGQAVTLEKTVRTAYSKLRTSVTKRWNALPEMWRQRLQQENDLHHIEVSQRKYYQYYSDQWLVCRDSIHALLTVKEIKKLRARTRVYIKSLLDGRSHLLLNEGIITAEIEAMSKKSREEETKGAEAEAVDETEKQQSKNGSPRKGRKKAQKKASEEEDSKRNDEDVARAAQEALLDDEQLMPIAASAAASRNDDGNSVAAASSSSSSAAAAAAAPLSSSSSDGRNVDALHAHAISRLKTDIDKLREAATQKYKQAARLRFHFGLESSGAPKSLDNHLCSICRQTLTLPAVTLCGHYFDVPCLQGWINKKLTQYQTPSCPECRHPLSDDDWHAFTREELPTPIRHEPLINGTEEVILGVETNANADEQNSADQQLASSSANSSSSAAPLQRSSSTSSSSNLPSLSEVQATSVKGEGNLGTKVEYTVKYIKAMQNRDPHVKVLVFSNFPRILGMVASALAFNDIKHLHLSGSPSQRARQLDSFQTDSSFTALLLSLRHDNSGLTLVSATAVILMEPSLNPSVEAQAINRVHRIGQTRETHVLKLLMAGSVEQTIDQMGNEERRGEVVATGADALTRQGKEALSVQKLLHVLNLSDDNGHRQNHQQTTTHTGTGSEHHAEQ